MPEAILPELPEAPTPDPKYVLVSDFTEVRRMVLDGQTIDIAHVGDNDDYIVLFFESDGVTRYCVFVTDSVLWGDPGETETYLACDSSAPLPMEEMAEVGLITNDAVTKFRRQKNEYYRNKQQIEERERYLELKAKYETMIEEERQKIALENGL